MRRLILWLPVLLGCGLVFFLYPGARSTPAPPSPQPDQAEQQRWQQEVARLQARKAEQERLQRKAEEAAFNKTLAQANRQREQYERAAPADTLPADVPRSAMRRAPADVRAYLSKTVGLMESTMEAAMVLTIFVLESGQDPSLLKDQRRWLEMRAACTQMRSAGVGLQRVRPVPAQLRHADQLQAKAGAIFQAHAEEGIRAIDARDHSKLKSALARINQNPAARWLLMQWSVEVARYLQTTRPASPEPS